MTNSHWLDQLQVLIAKYNQLGIDSDISTLSLVEKWALYLHLLRLAES
jgi:hypothetical protein